MGMRVSAFHAEYISSGKLLEKDSFYWDSARENRKRISDEIATGLTDVETGALRDVADFEKSLLGKIGEEKQDSFAVTNLGIIKSSGGETRANAAPLAGTYEILYFRSPFT